MNAIWQDVEILSDDGIRLRGWVVRPKAPNGRAVILLHGVGDTRAGMLDHARFLIDGGYSCLLPDARAHGESGGQIITYGVREAHDVKNWADFLERTVHPTALFGLGESLGGAVLLEALPLIPRFQAVAVESSFDEFSNIALDRLVRLTGVNSRWLFQHLIQTSFLYTRIRYGVRLEDASPIRALKASKTPKSILVDSMPPVRPPTYGSCLAAIMSTPLKLTLPVSKSECSIT